MTTKLVAVATKDQKSTAVAAPAEDAEENPRPMLKSVLGFAVVGGAAAVTYIALDGIVDEAVKAAVDDPAKTDKKKAEVDVLNMYGAGQVVGGIVVGVAGRSFIGAGLLRDVTDGVGVGLIVHGGVNLYAAYLIENPPNNVLVYGR